MVNYFQQPRSKMIEKSEGKTMNAVIHGKGLRQLLAITGGQVLFSSNQFRCISWGFPSLGWTHCAADHVADARYKAGRYDVQLVWPSHTFLHGLLEAVWSVCLWFCDVRRQGAAAKVLPFEPQHDSVQTSFTYSICRSQSRTRLILNRIQALIIE